MKQQNKKYLRREDVKAALDAALAGSRKLKLVFNRDAFTDIYYLLAMVHQNVVQLRNEFEAVLLQAIAQSHNWDNDKNRTVIVILPSTFDAEGEEFFLGRMKDRALESISVV